MRRFLLAATILASFTVAPAFAGGHNGGNAAANLGGAASFSAGGVLASQGTTAAAVTAGNGSSFQSATARNVGAINTTGAAKAGRGIADTGSFTRQMQAGGTTAVSNSKVGKGLGNDAGGNASATQGTSVFGGAVAGAADVHGFAGTQPAGHGRR